MFPLQNLARKGLKKTLEPAWVTLCLATAGPKRIVNNFATHGHNTARKLNIWLDSMDRMVSNA